MTALRGHTLQVNFLIRSGHQEYGARLVWSAYRLHDHSILIPASVITLLHRAISSATKARNSSGVLPTATMPCSASLSFIAGSASAFLASAETRSTISLGVPAGAMMPAQVPDTKSGTP